MFFGTIPTVGSWIIDWNLRVSAAGFANRGVTHTTGTGHLELILDGKKYAIGHGLKKNCFLRNIYIKLT